MVADSPLTDPTTNVGPEAGLMAQSGVESVHLPFFWYDMQPHASFAQVPPGDLGRFRDGGGVPTDFTNSDRLVAAFARRGMTVLPTVVRSPRWALADPSEDYAPPADVQAYARFMTVLVGRYGPQGSFWREHGDVPRVPIREWQLWNEPSLRVFWSVQPFARSYVNLLRAGRNAVKAADRSANVVLAGLPNDSYNALRAIYRAGGKPYFDTVAIHPYTGTPAGLITLLKRNRSVMHTYRDDRKPLAVTEFSWASGRGRSAGSRVPWNTTDAGQAKQLTAAYTLFARNRVALRIAHVYWYTWFTPETTRQGWQGFTGLRRQGPGGLVSKPALAAYRAIARKLTR